MNEWMGKNFAYETETVYCSDIKPKVFSTDVNFLEAPLAEFSLLVLSTFSQFLCCQLGRCVLSSLIRTVKVDSEKQERKLFFSRDLKR